MNRHARHFLITGEVQGVGFRYAARRAALRLELSGWVRNLADGRVEATAEGGADDLARFEAWLRVGPAQAKVREVKVTSATPTSVASGNTGDFCIR